ncbi:M13 family peptidase [Pseudoduganella sp. DS3]|uniref:M13 family peptidase n=1 Tax=Pseudoduganella guangdongensis TaxID=2692179 RepID=A0A6N9HCQ3_9BURK|nr:M13-type metalloendopeptidase [Pseudoduganella guangdongensis]MYN01318.1 M13 family peptidase [Pseudoduganella guangdongensis]
MKRKIISAVVVGLFTANAAFAAGKAPLKSGIEVQHMDKAVRAQDDFYLHTNGAWMKNIQIPADRSSWGTFAVMAEEIQPRLRALIEEAAAKGGSADAKRVGDLFASMMDEARAEQLGITPLAGERARIAALNDKKQLAAQFAQFSRMGVSSPFDVSIHQDNKDSTRYVADLAQSGLSMPDRDYYLKKDDAKLADTLAKFEAHVARMLALAGDKNAAATAKAVVNVETRIAQIQWTKVELRDPVKAYNKYEVAKLNELMPGFDFNTWLDGVHVGGKVKDVIVSQPTYLQALDKVIAEVPLEDWKAYLDYRLLATYSPQLSKAFVDENFAFYGTTLSGATEQRPRWKRAVTLTEGAMGEAVGKLYVAKHFPPEAKARMEVLVKNLLLAFKQSIDTLEWMGPATRKEAHAKLAKFTTKIGYPNKWRDYSALEIKRDDLVGNVMRANQFEHNRNVAKLGKPIDREEWLMPPQQVNAYYNPEMNEIVFPAAILQPPFFDMKADDAVNYGGIGAVIGHEISHGFDDQGSQFDGNGNLRNWWTEEDGKRFKERTAILVKQYGEYEALPGYQVNGELTLGENIGDNSGLAVAYKAYKLSLKGKKAPVIDGFTGEQRFYMGWAQVWRTKYRDAALISRVKTDPHSPGPFRANGTLRNQPGFYDAYSVKEGDKLYLPPKDRAIIW